MGDISWNKLQLAHGLVFNASFINENEPLED